MFSLHLPSFFKKRLVLEALFFTVMVNISFISHCLSVSMCQHYWCNSQRMQSTAQGIVKAIFLPSVSIWLDLLRISWSCSGMKYGVKKDLLRDVSSLTLSFHLNLSLLVYLSISPLKHRCHFQFSRLVCFLSHQALTFLFSSLVFLCFI